MSAIYEIEKDIPETKISENFILQKDEIKYKFMIEADKELIEIVIIKQDEKNKSLQIYEKKLNLNGVVSLNKKFSKFTSCINLLKYIINHKENIIIDNNYVGGIKLELENIPIKLELIKAKQHLDLLMNSLFESICNLKENINANFRIYIKDNKKINSEIDNLKSIYQKQKDENENIKDALKIIKEENEKLKKENENIRNKTNQLEEKLNKITSNKAKILSIEPINNNKNPEIRNKEIKIDINPSEAKTNPNTNSRSRKPSQVIYNNTNPDELNNTSKQKAKNILMDGVKKNISKVIYNTNTSDSKSNKKKKNKLSLNLSNDPFDEINDNIEPANLYKNNSLIVKKSEIELKVRNILNEFNKNKNKKKKINLPKELKNIYNIYINPTIQCFFNIENLIINFLCKKREIKLNKNENILSFSFLQIIDNVCEDKNFGESIKNFKNVIDKLNPSFEYNNQNNSLKDFILFSLEEMHKELNEVKNVDNDIKQYSDQNLDKYIKNMEGYFKKNFNSIISDIFYFMENNQTKCLNCNNIMNDIKINDLLIFSMEKIKSFKGNNRNLITINDCLNAYKKTKFSDQVCDHCMKKDKLEYNNFIMKSPKILMIYLNYEKKQKMKLKLEENIYLDNFINNQNNKNKYELINIVIKFESNYITFCKNLIEEKWYKYEDSNVILSRFDRLKSDGIPFLLFYLKKE